MFNFFYNYMFLAIFFCTSLVISFILISLTQAFSKKLIDYKKLVAYECGFNSFSSARIMFDVHFFIVALLFLVFDVELIFLYPWSVSLYFLNTKGLISVYLFLLIIIVGYIYEWRKGALNWILKF